MAEIDTIVDELRHICGNGHTNRPRSDHLIDADVNRWSARLGVPRASVYDQIAASLARQFHRSVLDFSFCDAVVNDLHSVITLADEDRPKLFWVVYLAFDEGEYQHRRNPEDDPVETYTRPMIAAVVGQYGLE